MQKIEKVTSRAYAKLENGLEFNPTETGKYIRVQFVLINYLAHQVAYMLESNR